MVSAIVAAYNYGDYLPRTLDSALTQDYPADRLEIVIVDDGSTDHTPEVVADYAARFPGRIRAFRQDNAGYVAATNRAFAEARGDLWALLDADDLWPPGKTAAQVAIFARRPEVGLVYGDLEVIDADDRTLRPSHWAHEHVSGWRGRGLLVPLLVQHNMAGASSIMLRASLAGRFAPVPATVPYVDWWCAMQVAAVAELDFLDDPKVGYREHGGNLTLGAQGWRLAREMVKQAMTRRSVIVHGGAGALPAPALVAAWAAVERDVQQAVGAAGTVYLDYPPQWVEDRPAAAEAVRRSAVLAARGRPEPALRAALVAAAHRPTDVDARRRLTDLAQALEQGLAAPGHPFADARGVVVLAGAAELVAEPALLAAYAGALGPADDVTLVIHAGGWDADRVGEELGGLADRLGIGEDGPDLLALPDAGGHLAPAELASAADVRLGAAGAGDGADGPPAFGVAEVPELAALVRRLAELVRPPERPDGVPTSR